MKVPTEEEINQAYDEFNNLPDTNENKAECDLLEARLEKCFPGANKKELTALIGGMYFMDMINTHRHDITCSRDERKEE